MTQPDPQGARALAERLHRTQTGHIPDDDLSCCRGSAYSLWASEVLSDHGLFIVDVREHEPTYATRSVGDGRRETSIICACGWVRGPGESYFDHISGDPS
jgi:hypothetical protein